MNAEQKQLVLLAEEMTDLCRRHGIKFVIGFGCAIGVERNQGFLPWDDDIDLIITRKELKKLSKLLAEEMPLNRAWVTDERYPDYHHSLARYVNTESTRLARFRIMDGTPLGQLLEFFVFDPIPNGEKARKEYEKWLWLYTELQASVVVVGRLYSPAHVIDRELYYKYLKRIENEGKQAVLDEIEKKHLTFKEEDCDYMACRWGSKLLLIKRDWWDNIEYRSFDGSTLPFFKDNIEHLQLRYGYTWNIIPEEGSELTHGVIVDSHIPYGRFIDQIREKAVETDMTTALQENKNDKLERLFARFEIQRLSAFSERAFLNACIRELKKSNIMFCIDNLNELTAKYEPIYEVMFRQHYAKWHMPPEVSDSIKEVLFLTLLHSNQIDRCELFLDLYQDWDKHDEYKCIMEHIWELQREKYYGHFDRVRAIIKWLEGEGLEQQLEVERATIWLLTEDITENTLRQADNAIKSIYHRNDLEIHKYLFDFAYASDDKERCEQEYEIAKHTRDGVLLLSLMERIK